MPTPFRHTEPLPPKAATGRVAEVYAQAARDFGIPEPAPFVALSSAPALVAPAWALMRESLLAGPGDRTGKEVAAFGVSQANKCRFCVDAHTMLLHATGDHALAERLAGGGSRRTSGTRAYSTGRGAPAFRVRRASPTRSRPRRLPATSAPCWPSTSSTASCRPW